MRISKQPIRSSKYISESSDRCTGNAEDLIRQAIESLSECIPDHPDDAELIRDSMANLSVILLDLKGNN